MQHLDGLFPWWWVHENFVGSFQIHADTFEYDLSVDFYRAGIARAFHSE